MVKADASRNYYADLGVPANAGENEIRKAFRQLALQCHPDRNPGREAEVVARFQQIQAAHEVLSDPAQRTKYDAERRKYRNINFPPQTPNTPRARPPPPPRNAYTTTPSGSYYRPPPPRPSPQRPPPPQHNASFTNGADRFTSKNFRAPPTAPRPHSGPKDAGEKANVFTAWQKMKQPRAEEPRAHPQNNPNGMPFGRSQSTRVPSSKKGFDPGTPGADEGQARSSYRSNYARPAPPPSTPADPAVQTEADNVPFAEGNRTRTPYFSTASGERTSMFGEGASRSSSVRNSPAYHHRPASSADTGFNADSGPKPHRNSYGGPARKPFLNLYPDSSGESSGSEDLSRETKHRGPPPSKESPQSKTYHQTRPQSSTPSNTGPEAVPNAFKSRSEESVNMKFSPSDWHGKFQGSADYFAPKVPKGTPGKGRISPTRGRQSGRATTDKSSAPGQSMPFPAAPPFAQTTSTQMPPPPPGPPPGQPSPDSQTAFPPGATSVPHPTKFNDQEWAETFKEPSWAFPSKSQETSPRRGSTATKRPPPKATRKASVPGGGGANSENSDEKSKPRYQAFAEDATNGDGDAMDIDSDAPAMENTKTAPSAGGQPTPGIPQEQRDTGKAQNGFQAAPPPAPANNASALGLGGMGGLANVEPFFPTANGGLSGLDELKDTLPFKSQASNCHPTKPNAAQKLQLPRLPAAPAPPQKLEAQSAKKYLNDMEAYVREFRGYRRVIMTHFAARDAEMDDLDDGFLEQRGETTNKIGFAGYVRRMKEDEGILETLKIGHELHIKALEQCEEVRNKSRKLSRTPVS